MHQFFEDKVTFYLVQELILGGELFEKILSRQYFVEEEARKTAGQILLAVEYLHSLGIGMWANNNLQFTEIFDQKTSCAQRMRMVFTFGSLNLTFPSHLKMTIW